MKDGCSCVNCQAGMDEEQFIEFMVKKYDLGLVQASAIFYKVKEYLE